MGAELMSAVSAKTVVENTVPKRSMAQSSTTMLLRRLSFVIGMFPPS
jgi:hypothetical protein